MIFERKATSVERFFTRSPFSTVTMVARIKGNVTEEMLMYAVGNVQQRHILLKVRIKDDHNHEQWFTIQDVRDIPAFCRELIQNSQSKKGWDWPEGW